MLCGALPAVLAFLLFRRPRIRRLDRMGLRSGPAREAVLAVLWAYAGAIAAIALTPRWVIWSLLGWAQTGAFSPGGPCFSLGTMNLIPFQTFGLTPHLLYNLLGNVLLFLPFGLFAALLWRGFGWKRALLAGVCITGPIEVWQLLVGRTFDVDDLMLNALGVLCGFWLALALRRLFPRQAAGLLVRPAPPHDPS